MCTNVFSSMVSDLVEQPAIKGLRVGSQAFSKECNIRTLNTAISLWEPQSPSFPVMKGDLCKTPPFTQSWRQTQISFLEILYILLEIEVLALLDLDQN